MVAAVAGPEAPVVVVVVDGAMGRRALVACCWIVFVKTQGASKSNHQRVTSDNGASVRHGGLSCSFLIGLYAY